MTRPLLLLAGLLAISLGGRGSCLALLDEDEKTVGQRYGKPIPELVDHLGPLLTRGYLVKNFYVALVVFDHGRSISEAYSRADGKRFAESSISACLKGNGHSRKWRAVPAAKDTARTWVIGNGEAYAAYVTEGKRPLLFVFTRAFIPYFQKYHDFASAKTGKLTRP